MLDALDALNDLNDPDPRFLTTRAVHAGINNLPKHISAQVAQRVLDGGFEHSGAGLHSARQQPWAQCKRCGCAAQSFRTDGRSPSQRPSLLHTQDTT